MPLPTVVPCSNYDPIADAETLRSAMLGFGADEQQIIDIITVRSNAQRQVIAESYYGLCDGDLIKDFKRKLSNNLKELIVGLMYPPVTYLCKKLHHSLSGMSTDATALIDILCTKTKGEMDEIVETYANMYNRPLAGDICSGTSGDFQRLLTYIASGVRDESGQVDRELAKSQANQLYEAGEARWGTNEGVFNTIMTHSSFDQLRLISDEYEQLRGHSIVKAIESEMSGNLRKASKAIVRYAHSPTEFFAVRLYKSMKGLGTDDKTLVRIIVSRAEIDLEDIKAIYKRLYDRELVSDVKDDTSGNYRNALVAIIGE